MTCYGSVLLLLLSTPHIWEVSAKDPEKTPLNEWPMVMCHDAATTYLRTGLVNKWYKTQMDGGPRQELVCGARSFDWRPAVVGDTVYMHHAGNTIKVPMAQALDEMVSWANTNGTAVEELVHIGITDISGDDLPKANAMVEALLRERNISFVRNCSRLQTTAAAAARMATLPGGGHLLATFDCWEENYEPAVACSGYAGDSSDEELQKPSYDCAATSPTKAYPVARMLSYLHNVSAAGPPVDGSLYTSQCIWQETPDSVVVGELHGSSLLLDEARSGLNALLAQWITGGGGARPEWNVSRIGLVEVNNVCNGGLQLLQVLRALPN
jgi:hypothetical protein